MNNRIRELRKKKNLTMKQLGAILGLAESTISQYETGRREPDTKTLIKLSDYFGVTVDYLLGNTESPLIFRPSHTAPVAFDEQKIMEAAGIDPLKEIDIGFYGAYSELTEDDKKTIRDMVMLMRERRKDKK